MLASVELKYFISLNPLHLKFFSKYNSSKNDFQLRNTDYVFGCAVYTGRDTKMSRVCKEYFAKNADSLFAELKAGQKQVFDCGGDDEQGAPRLHAHSCPWMHSLYNTQVNKSSQNGSIKQTYFS